MGVKPISFSGIYDIRFPVGTKQEEIDFRYKLVQDKISEIFPLSADYDVYLIDKFTKSESDKPLLDKGIRIWTTVQNPWYLNKLMGSIDCRFKNEQFDEERVEFVLNTNA